MIAIQFTPEDRDKILAGDMDCVHMSNGTPESLRKFYVGRKIACVTLEAFNDTEKTADHFATVRITSVYKGLRSGQARIWFRVLA